MEIGTAIAIASGILGLVAIIFRIFPKQGEKHCAAHSGVVMSVENLTEWLTKIEAKLDRVIFERRQQPRDEVLE